MNKDDDVTLIPVAIASQAAAGNVATIPATQATAGDGRVSIDLGYPPECAISVAAGGKYPEMQDANGVYRLLSSAIRSNQSWGILPFDADFAAGIGGYPAGAIVAGSTAGLFWVSTADNNVTVPGATGATWKSLFDGYATQAHVADSIDALAGNFQSGGSKVYYTGSSGARSIVDYHTAPVAGTYIVWAGVNVGAPPGTTQPYMAALNVYYNSAPTPVVNDSTPLSMSHCVTIPAAAGANTISCAYVPSSTSGTWYPIGLSLFYLFIPAG